jgi:hypothetical protein
LGRPNFLTCHANPGSTVSVALLQLAYALIYDTGDYQAGISALRAMGYDDNADVATLLGYASRKLGRYDDAKYWYDKALATDPNHHALTWSYYGMWHAEQGNLLKAKDDLEKVRQICGTECKEYIGSRRRSRVPALTEAVSVCLFSAGNAGYYESSSCSRSSSHLGAFSGCRIGPGAGVPPLRLRTSWLRLPSPPLRLPSSLRTVSLLENFEASPLPAAVVCRDSAPFISPTIDSTRNCSLPPAALVVVCGAFV